MGKTILLPVTLLMATSFFACSGNDDSVAGGPGSVTTNGIVAYVGDSPVAGALVSLRKNDYVAPMEENLRIVDGSDNIADSNGRFDVTVPDSGEYRLTVAHDGIAYSKVVTLASYEDLDTVRLSATATFTGVADIPAGERSIWVGVMGTDVMVKSDSEGIFVIPTLPAGDTLELYFMGENGDSLARQPIYLKPYEQALVNYKRPVPDTVAIDTVETVEDTVQKVTVLLSDGTPASYATVALRKASALAPSLIVCNSVVAADLHADDEGRFTMEWPSSGEYRLTVTSGGNSYSGVYAAGTLVSLDTLTLSPTVKLTGKATLKANESFAWVGVYGLDELVKTDATGAYVLPALPANDSLVVYFIHDGDSSAYVEWSVATSDEDISEMPSMTLYDFETDGDWYMSVDTLWKGTTFYTLDGEVDSLHLVADHLELDSTRNSMVFHAKYNIAFDPYAWVLLGTQLKETVNLSLLDSIEFYAKGDGNIRVALENWENYDNAIKAASDWVQLDSSWTRYVFTPEDLCTDGDEKKDCDTVWDAVKGSVKQLHIFPRGGSEFYVDDVKLYGALF